MLDLVSRGAASVMTLQSHNKESRPSTWLRPTESSNEPARLVLVLLLNPEWACGERLKRLRWNSGRNAGRHTLMTATLHSTADQVATST